MKQKFKKFFTLDHRKSDGFTLVELIIVIAILAILGGASVPAYNLYVKKARESADQQILAAVNTAFASACLESKIDVEEVGSAAISVIGGQVNGLSRIAQATARTTDARFNLDVIDTAFRRYYEGNEGAVFATENVNSLNWEDGAFVISATVEDARILMNDGKFLTVSAEELEKIQNSAYADMGYEEVAGIIAGLNGSSEKLYSLASLIGMEDRFINAMVSYGIVSSAGDASDFTAEEAANALQLVTAMNLAGMSDEAIQELATKQLSGILGEGSMALVQGLAQDGGANTIAAVGLQYALAEGFAQTDAGKSEAYKGTVKIQTGTKYGVIPVYTTYSYDCSSTEEFLNSDAAKADPVWAINQIKKTSGYNAYTTTDPQYQKDIDGFIGTMSVVGNNASTTKNPNGAINTQDYINNGINSQDAKDALTSILGK